MAAQHATLAFRAADLALAGDDEHEGQAVVMGTLQEAEEHAMCARLRHAVQVEPGIDILPAARQLRALATPERCQRRCRWFWRGHRRRGRLWFWQRRLLHRDNDFGHWGGRQGLRGTRFLAQRL